MDIDKRYPTPPPTRLFIIRQHTSAFDPIKPGPKELRGSFSDDLEEESVIKLECGGRWEKGRVAWGPIVELR